MLEAKWRVPDTSPYTYSKYDSSGFGAIIPLIGRSFTHFAPVRQRHTKDDFVRAFEEYADDLYMTDERFRKDALDSVQDIQDVICKLDVGAITWEDDVSPFLKTIDTDVMKYLNIGCKHSLVGDLMLRFELTPQAIQRSQDIGLSSSPKWSVFVNKELFVLPLQYKFTGGLGRDDTVPRFITLCADDRLISLGFVTPEHAFEMLD